MVAKVNNIPNGRITNKSQKRTNEAIEMNFIRHKLENFQTTIVKDVEKRIAIMVDEVIQELQQQELQIQEFQSFASINRQNESETWNNRTFTVSTCETEANVLKTKNSKTDKEVNKLPNTQQNKQKHYKTYSPKGLQTLPDKIFKARESYLTALLKVDHMRSIYHIFHIIFLVLCSQTIAHDYFVEGKVNFGLKTFKSGFRGIHYVLGIWLLQHVFVFLLYYAFRTWSYARDKLQKQAVLQRIWSQSCLITYIISQLVFGYVSTALCLKLNLPYVSSCVLLLESIRLLMKMHAFVRTNAARVIAGKLKCDEDISAKPNKAQRLAPFSWYLYFLFAPTLLYRDSYPRTSTIRWKFAFCRFLEGLAAAFLFAYLHERYMYVHFGNFGLEAITPASLIVKVFGMCMPSIIIYLCGFYLLLHSWLNFTAELLRFGDRMFYKDWWTVYNYADFYRKWNVVVHDWLYEYIYKDFYNHIFRGSKTCASIMVFTASAIVHEYVIGFALQFLFPVMFVFFGLIGSFLVFLTRSAPKSFGNVFLWFSLISGNCLMVSLYYMEYFTRKNCNVANESWSDFLTPALWKCKATVI